MPKPNFRAMWTGFPDHVRFRTLGDPYRHLGGAAERNIDVPGFGETGNGCASRMSVAMNAGGLRIDQAVASRARARTIGTRDGSRIIYGVADLQRYLPAVLGRPMLDSVSPYDDTFRGKTGIVAFGVTGWDDAVGHVALFDGRSYREPGYDDYSVFARGQARTVRGQFWEIA